MEAIKTIIEILAAVGVGVIAGNGAVYGFNHIPAEWFTPDGCEPTEEVLSRDRQRIPSYPWKYIMTASFIIVLIFMAVRDWQYAVPAACAVWLLLELAISCGKYRVMPDQLVVLLFATGFGFIPYHSTWRMIIWGVAAGCIAAAVIWLIVRFALQREASSATWHDRNGYISGRHSVEQHKSPLMGMNEIAVGGALGLIMGPQGVVAVMAAGILASGLVTGVRALTHKSKKGDLQPVGTYVCAAAMIYIVLHIRIFGF